MRNQGLEQRCHHGRYHPYGTPKLARRSTVATATEPGGDLLLGLPAALGGPLRAPIM